MPSELQLPPPQPDFGNTIINQENLLPVIIINQPPRKPIIELIQPSQQLQQPFQQPQQQQQMAYAPIAKLEKFSGEEDDTQTWINDVTKAIVTGGFWSLFLNFVNVDLL
ncbi:hypothetical protein G9A89_016396 [Geosiphon pyriformis]|nr:hypothetical protein G9A89_016396 [Geosiphon pyriformis]